jgi:hypothetical protein
MHVKLEEPSTQFLEALLFAVVVQQLTTQQLIFSEFDQSLPQVALLSAHRKDLIWSFARSEELHKGVFFLQQF